MYSVQAEHVSHHPRILRTISQGPLPRGEAKRYTPDTYRKQAGFSPQWPLVNTRDASAPIYTVFPGYQEATYPGEGSALLAASQRIGGPVRLLIGEKLMVLPIGRTVHPGCGHSGNDPGRPRA